MTVAVSKAVEARRQGGHLRLHRQHRASRRRLRGPGRADLRGARAAGQDRARQAGPGAGARRQAAAGRRQLRRLPGAGRASSPLDYPVALVNSVNPDRLDGPEDRRVRDRRRARRRARRPLPAGRQRRQHHRLLDGLPRVRDAGGATPRAADVRLPGRRRGADRAPASRCREPSTIATAIRIGNPASLDHGDGRPGRVRRPDRRGHRPGDPRRLPAAGPRGRRSSSSWPPRPAWPGCCSRPRDGRVPRRARRWSARSPATA